jgi:hypothetical protein
MASPPLGQSGRRCWRRQAAACPTAGPAFATLRPACIDSKTSGSFHPQLSIDSEQSVEVCTEVELYPAERQRRVSVQRFALNARATRISRYGSGTRPTRSVSSSPVRHKGADHGEINTWKTAVPISSIERKCRGLPRNRHADDTTSRAWASAFSRTKTRRMNSPTVARHRILRHRPFDLPCQQRSNARRK